MSDTYNKLKRKLFTPETVENQDDADAVLYMQLFAHKDNESMMIVDGKFRLLPKQKERLAAFRSLKDTMGSPSLDPEV